MDALVIGSALTVGKKRLMQNGGDLCFTVCMDANANKESKMERPTTPNREPKAAVGDRVDSYDGPGTVIEVRDDHAFYGAPPMRQGEYTGGAWDGKAYVVECDNGNTTIFDRTRISKI